LLLYTVIIITCSSVLYLTPATNVDFCLKTFSRQLQLLPGRRSQPCRCCLPHSRCQKQWFLRVSFGSLWNCHGIDMALRL